MKICIGEMERASVLAALWNASKQQGMGLFDKLGGREMKMTRADAADLLDRQGENPYFDYLRGRVMKIGFDGPYLTRVNMYDRDNGEGAALRALSKLPGFRDLQELRDALGEEESDD